MSRLSRRLAVLLARTGVGGPPPRTGGSDGWRAPLDDRLLRRLERASLRASQPTRGGLGGEHRSRARAASTDFADYRPYRPGDDFRQIDWNAYSRLDQLYVKLTEARERHTVYVLLDCSASMDSGNPSKFDLARQVAAVLGYVVLARYDRLEIVRLAGRGDVGRQRGGKQRFGELLALLDGLRATESLRFDHGLAGFRPSVGDQAIIISDMLHADGYESALETQAGVGLACSVVQVLSPQELDPPTGGDVELQDVESGERLDVGLSARAIDVYRARLADWCSGVERYCMQRGLRYVRLRSDEPIEHVALVGFRRAGILS